MEQLIENRYIGAKVGDVIGVADRRGFLKAETIPEPTGNQDIDTLNEYNVADKATARVGATERAKIIPENIKKDVTILGVTGAFEGGTQYKFYETIAGGGLLIGEITAEVGE